MENGEVGTRSSVRGKLILLPYMILEPVRAVVLAIEHQAVGKVNNFVNL